jgi:hypothetical protein
MRISIRGLKKIYDLTLIPHMVAGRKNVNAHVKEVLGKLGSDAEAGCRILSVSQHEIDGVLFH